MRDIGSGNTKIDYLEENPFRVFSTEIPYGTVSFSDFVNKGFSAKEEFGNKATRLVNTVTF